MVNELPIWLNQGVEPPESLKTIGWQPGMKPSAQHMNWLFNRSYLVMKELLENSGTTELQNELNALKAKVDTHLGNMVQHNQFVNGANKKIQVVLGWNDTLNCPTMEYVEVVE